MKHFSDRLLESIERKGSPICVGLDPRLNLIPKYIKDAQRRKYGNTMDAVGASLFHFNKKIIDTVKDVVPIVKPQMAFYECYGVAGIKAFISTVNYAKKRGLLVLEDGKRNDISSTAQAYAQGHLGEVDFFGKNRKNFDVDALTVTPYLGSDGIKPFVEVCNSYHKGIFVLVKTSNPSSDELQNLKVKKEFVYEVMAKLVNKWGKKSVGERGYSNIGAVVGATFPKEAKTLRKLMPHSFFLVPGYGAQGGGAKDIIPCFNKDGTGAIISSSRGIIFASKNPKDDSFTNDVLEATLAMQKDIRNALHKS